MCTEYDPDLSLAQLCHSKCARMTADWVCICCTEPDAAGIANSYGISQSHTYDLHPCTVLVVLVRMTIKMCLTMAAHSPCFALFHSVTQLELHA